ncbi:MAG: diaminobutyrate--2-oxoglutarate transaminase [Methanobacterium sp.]|jgi:diaminobutyrate-2-oxoglutarate transaminase|uniref:diaminobutyrate--2-oxoglutarate transaminase n=1 Tax=Methanobacterium sp. TaxID=2164 RepID=UPI002587A11D|nr:diaminobutyrate--2-oxoglutarate transaminase [Methanobacterium sp.]MCC7560403.1 diaminobutyrate--2-oxoglutarate transaminase [Methanobacterium sp.]
MKTFKQHESEVRSYIRSFPAIFKKAKGSILYDEQENEYIDFFAGAGTLNYGHNNPLVSEALIKYIQDDGIIHGLDKATTAKKIFLEKFYDIVLHPRHMEYKIQFTGPTGTNAVETALKLVRMVKGRSNIIAFTNAFHGLTLGSMAVTANSFYRDEAFINRTNVSFMPFDGYFGEDVNTADYLRKYLEDQSSGVDLPAAIILECIQAEGGINVASDEWLRNIEQICKDFDILLIVDDIQVGNGRTGSFFSFESSGINPDIITLSKSIGGGLPLSMVLLKSELDQWKPGEHTGTFRGNNLAFIASAELLSYWENDNIPNTVKSKEKILKERLMEIKNEYPSIHGEVRGKGLIYGLKIPLRGFCTEVSEEAFSRGLLIELAGAEDDVLKFLPPLTIEPDLMTEGLQIIEDSIKSVLEKREAMVEDLNNDS